MVILKKVSLVALVRWCAQKYVMNPALNSTIEMMLNVFSSSFVAELTEYGFFSHQSFLSLSLWFPFAELVNSWKREKLGWNPSITDGVHRKENFVEINPVFSTFSNFFKKKKKTIKAILCNFSMQLLKYFQKFFFKFFCPPKNRKTPLRSCS